MKNSQQHTPKQMMGRIGNRPYWVLILSIGIRAVHQLGAAVFVAAFLFDEVVRVPLLFSLLALASGFVLLFTEWLRHRQILRELSGAVTLAKLLLLGAAYHNFIPVVPAVVLAFLVASVGAHAPKVVRHRLLY